MDNQNPIFNDSEDEEYNNEEDNEDDSQEDNSDEYENKEDNIIQNEENYIESSLLYNNLSFNDYILLTLLGIQRSLQLNQGNSFINDINQGPSNIIEHVNQGNTVINDTEQICGRVRRRDEDDTDIKKTYKNNVGDRMIKRKIVGYNYIRFSSGKEYHFKKDDDKKIVLNTILEPNIYIRKLISKLPKSVKDRLLYLSEFMDDEIDVEEIDEIEIDEYIIESDYDPDKNKKSLFYNIKEQLITSCILELRLRSCFKKLLTLWRIYKMNKKCDIDVDPITLSKPEKEVYIYDWKTKKKYIFDAKSLATLIESKLLYSEDGFPMPMYPRNPWTNIEFNYGQLVSIYNQLKVYGELRWGLITLRQYDFNKSRWHIYHNSALTLSAIKNSIIQLDSYNSRELLEDFIFSKMDDLEIYTSNYIKNAYRIAMIKIPDYWYLQELKAIALIHYESEHFNKNRNEYINTRCKKIFRKQHFFIKYLIENNIIQSSR